MRWFPVLTALLTTTACATTPVPERQATRTDTRIESGGGNHEFETNTADVQNVTVVAHAPEQVFAALPGAYAALGFKRAAVVDTSGGVQQFGVRGVRLHGSLGRARLSRYVDCGAGGARGAPADSYEVTLSATSYVTPDSTGHGTSLHTLVMATARDMGIGGATPVCCSTTGALERRVAELAGRE